ncbi:hypothetical protein PoB_000038600 [Plakobranchus ocellatus]|uniref:Uncharacterized protein n=1 Tax=Plakobranchus ocellatus TaxID=259542 RepID=A0AAV3WTH0_9GAST|nr:hypothetical protein PoB_000038600 [Plakobranchus ocellatus]
MQVAAEGTWEQAQTQTKPPRYSPYKDNEWSALYRHGLRNVPPMPLTRAEDCNPKRTEQRYFLFPDDAAHDHLAVNIVTRSRAIRLVNDGCAGQYKVKGSLSCLFSLHMSIARN